MPAVWKAPLLVLATGLKPSTSNGLVTPRNGNPILPHNLAFKSAEIEELADVYFFRPLGMVVATAARALGLTPIGVTVLGTIIGIAGGVLLYDESVGLIAFALLIGHSIFDSADGQLARMTGRVTALGRALDGLSGYATHIAVYIAIAAGVIHRGGHWSIIVLMLLAGISSALHAGLYDYYRNTYIAVVVEGRLPGDAAGRMPGRFGRVFRSYLFVQRQLLGLHGKVETALAQNAVEGRVTEEDRGRYRECFYSRVRGWNLLGDNTRFYAVGIFACLHRIDLFFPFVLIAMNLAFLVLWFWQRQADQRFLAAR
jgi:hypothetical protein